MDAPTTQHRKKRGRVLNIRAGYGALILTVKVPSRFAPALSAAEATGFPRSRRFDSEKTALLTVALLRGPGAARTGHERVSLTGPTVAVSPTRDVPI
jgi:hypothetical protein